MLATDVSKIRHTVCMYNTKTSAKIHKGQEMKKQTTRLEKSEEKHKIMKCPYLSSSSQRICKRMIEASLDGEVSNFDIEHFCRGNPFYCYYFRSSPSK